VYNAAITHASVTDQKLRPSQEEVNVTRKASQTIVSYHSHRYADSLSVTLMANINMDPAIGRQDFLLTIVSTEPVSISLSTVPETEVKTT
jgi:hypothetical protein